MMNGNDPAAAAVMIEEEPANEFYANLFQHKRSKNRSLEEDNATIATVAITTTLNHSQTRAASSAADGTTASYISPEEPNIKTKVSDFGQVYQRAFHNPPTLSKISINAANKGHLLLTKMGWKEHEGGLGKCRQGTLTPIRSVWKRDYKGLGLVK